MSTSGTPEWNLIAEIFGDGSPITVGDKERDLIRKAAQRGYRHTPKRFRNAQTHPRGIS